MTIPEPANMLPYIAKQDVTLRWGDHSGLSGQLDNHKAPHKRDGGGLESEEMEGWKHKPEQCYF